MRLKLNDQGYDILKDELSKNENENIFSKTNNVMLAFDLMEKGEELTTKVTKANLANIIKILCNKLKFNEEPEEDQVPENKDITISTNEKDETRNEETPSMKKNSEKTCKFYKTGNCKYGKSGKTKDQNGKSCEFNHPPTCKKFELFGYKKGGCKYKKCSKLHVSLCKMFMRQKNFKYGDDCKFFHPRRLKNNSQIKKPTSQSYMRVHEENPTYAQIAKNTYQTQVQPSESGAFLGQTQNFQQPVMDQGSQFQQPVLSQRSNTQAFLELQDGQRQMMQLFMNMNQKLMNLEKQKFILA